ncbi:iron transporter Fth1p [[Candida] anglica]
MFEDYFSIQIFFIIFRETLETAIIVSVLLAFIHQRFGEDVPETSIKVTKAREDMRKKLSFQVWMGAVMGLVVCVLIGAVFVLSFYIIGKDFWSYTERVWEGVFSLLSSIIITVMGIGLLRINKVMKVKWWVKLGDAYNEGEGVDGDVDQATLLGVEDSNGVADIANANESSKKKAPLSKRYFLAILPFVTTLREGLEAVVFVGGIGMSQPPSSLPISILGGITMGAIVGYVLYRGGNHMSLQYFLIFSTCFLYMVSAGLMSRGVWFLELESYVRKCGGLDVSETGSGPGSYDISKSVWHVNCCNGLTDGWWMVFNAIFGWTNSATYGSVGSYCAYWILVITWLEAKLYEEREGYLPFIPVKWQLKRIRKRVMLFEARNGEARTSYERIEGSERGDSIDQSIEEERGLLT